MAANKYRGEIEAILDGKPYRLCLTLGALAELESAFGDDDMLALASRFEQGRLKARDALRVIGAGLRGAGVDISDEKVAAMRADGGAAGFVSIVAMLLSATFGGDGQQSPAQSKSEAGENAPAPGGRGDPAPFPGPKS